MGERNRSTTSLGNGTRPLHQTSVTGLKHHKDKHDDDPIGPIERVTEMAKQFSDSTKHSDISAESTNSVDCSSLIPLRDRLAGPDVPASSPSHRRSRSMLFTSCLVGVILAGGTSAVIAFRQFSLADIWRGRAQL